MSLSAPYGAGQGGHGSPPESLLTEIERYYEQHQLRVIDLAPTPAGAVTASSLVVHGGANFLAGWSLIETTGAATAAIRLRDGKSAADAVILRIDLSAGESTRDFMEGHGIRVQTGHIWLEWLSGSIEGTLFVR